MIFFFFLRIKKKNLSSSVTRLPVLLQKISEVISRAGTFIGGGQFISVKELQLAARAARYSTVQDGKSFQERDLL